MALDNLISVLFTAQELADIDAALTTIEAIIRPKAINLTAEQRRQYGSIAEQNKRFVNKAREYMTARPDLVPHVLDATEFEKDYAARTVIEGRANRLDGLNEMFSDTKILLDHDNYFNALTFYRYVRFLANENEPGITTIYEDMKQFFTGGRPASPVTPTTPTDEE